VREGQRGKAFHIENLLVDKRLQSAGYRGYTDDVHRRSLEFAPSVPRARGEPSYDRDIFPAVISACSVPFDFDRLRPNKGLRSPTERAPAAPIILRDGQHLADCGTALIKEPLLGRLDFITLRNGGRRCHAIRLHLNDTART
jgi:hypothetical protein